MSVLRMRGTEEAVLLSILGFRRGCLHNGSRRIHDVCGGAAAAAAYS